MCKGMTWPDLMTDSFRRTKMIQLRHLEPHARIHVRACLRTDCVVLHACCGCILCTLPVDLSVLRSSNQKPDYPACSYRIFFKKKKLIHCSSSDFEECHHQEFQFCHEDCAMMRRRRRSMRQVSLLLIISLPSFLPTNNIVIFFTSDFDVFCAIFF